MPFFKVYIDYAISESACDRILTNGIPPEIYATPVRVDSVSRSPEQTLFLIECDDEDIANAWHDAIRDTIGLVQPLDYTPPTPDPAPAPLDVWVKVGTWTKSIGNATTTVSGLTSTPKGLILWGSGLSGAAFGTYNDNGAVVFGFSDGTDNRSLGFCAQDNQATTNTNQSRCQEAFHLLDSSASATSVILEGCTASFGATSFDLNWDGTTLATVGFYFVFGGSDIASCKIMDFRADRATTGVQTYTGLGGRFDFGLFLTPNVISASGIWATQTGTAGAMHSISAHAGSDNTHSWCSNIASRDAATGTYTTGRLQRLEKLHHTMDPTSVNQQQVAEWKGWTSDGFTLDWIDAAVSGQFLFTGLFVKGGKWDAGYFYQPTTNGTVTTLLSDTSSAVQGLLALSVNNTNMSTSTNGVAPAKWAIGGEDLAGNRGCLAYAEGNTTSTTEATVMVTDRFMKHITAAATASSSTTDAQCTISDMATDGQFTANYTTTDATARQTVWFSLSA